LRKLYLGKAALPADLRQAPPAFQDRFLVGSSLLQLRTERNEFDSLEQTKAQLRAAKFPEDLPLTVITALESGSRDHARPAPAYHRELQKQLAAESLFGRQVLAANSGPAVQLEEPNLVITAIEDMIQRSRATVALSK
jgi:hypothetical protein